MKKSAEYLGNPVLVFLSFFITTLLFYYRTVGAGFTYDFVGIAHRYDGIDIHGLPKYFSQNGFLPVYHLVMYTMYKTFRLNGLPWLVVACALHSMVALLLFKIIRKLVDSEGIAVTSALMFLLHPLQVETVVWVAAIHYLICACLMLGILLSVMQYAQTKNRWLLFLIPLLQLIAHFTLEESLVIPFMSGMIIWLAPDTLFKAADRRNTAIAAIAPQLLAVVVYFGIHLFIMGSLYSHNKGGGADPFSDLSFATLTTHHTKFLLKLVAFLPYAQYNQYTAIFTFIALPVFTWSMFGVLVAGFILLLFKLNRFKSRGRILFLFLLLYSIALAPVINFPHLAIFPCQNERYGYFASMFLMPLLVLSFQLLPRYKFAPVGIFAGCGIYFLVVTTGWWKGERVVRDGLIKDFRWYDKEHIYILSLPESFHGAWMFQAPADSNMFAQFVEIYTGKDLKTKMTEVTQFVMGNVKDSVSVNVKSDSVLAISSLCPGAWFTHVKGNSPHENPYYQTSGDALFIDFKRKLKQPNSVYIYSVGDKWKEVAF